MATVGLHCSTSNGTQCWCEAAQAHKQKWKVHFPMAHRQNCDLCAENRFVSTAGVQCETETFLRLAVGVSRNVCDVCSQEHRDWNELRSFVTMAASRTASDHLCIAASPHWRLSYRSSTHMLEHTSRCACSHFRQNGVFPSSFTLNRSCLWMP